MATRQVESNTAEFVVREFKAKLSEHLSRVKAGATVTVTERGTPIARLVPIERIEPPEHLKALIESGAVRWSGLPMLPHRPRPLIGSGKTPSQMISEDRDDRS